MHPLPDITGSIECGPENLVCTEDNECCSGRCEAFVEDYPELQFCRGTTDVEGLPEPKPKAVPEAKPQDAVFRSMAEGAGRTPRQIPSHGRITFEQNPLHLLPIQILGQKSYFFGQIGQKRQKFNMPKRTGPRLS